MKTGLRKRVQGILGLAAVLVAAPGGAAASSVLDAFIKGLEDDQEQRSYKRRVRGSGPVESERRPESTPLSSEAAKALVEIEGDKNDGRGFLCRISGRLFVATNESVLAGNEHIRIKDAAGEVIRHGGIFGAVGADLAIIRVEERPGALEVMEEASEANLAGAKVVTARIDLGGRVDGTRAAVDKVGQHNLSLKKDLVPGNSGNPIIDESSGKVIGIACFSNYFETGAKLGELKVKSPQWSAFRLDNVKRWEKIDWKTFVKQGQQLRAIEEVTIAFAELVKTKGRKYRNNLEIYNAYKTLKKENSAIRQSPDYYAKNIRIFVTRLLFLAKEDIREFEKRKVYDYYRYQTFDQRQYRDFIIGMMDGKIEEELNLKQFTAG